MASTDGAAEPVTDGGSVSNQLIENGWFIEKNKDWPGIAIALEVKEVLLNKQTAIQDMLIFKSTNWGNVLVLDGCIMVTERDEMAYQEMMAHLPMFSHADPRRVLVVGGGDGGIMREVCKHGCVESVVLCEIDGEVVEACKQFFPGMASSFSDERATVHIMDAVEYVKKSASDSFDVIIVDSSDPIGPAVELFSKSFYEEMHRILSPGGVVCTQGESIWVDLDLVTTLVTENGKIFASAEYASINTPTYIGGQLGAFLCRKADASQPDCKPSCYKPSRKVHGMPLRFYTEELHSSSFHVPAFVKQRFDMRSRPEWDTSCDTPKLH